MDFEVTPNEFLLEVFHRLEFLQIEQFTFEQTEEVFYHSIVQAIPFSAHALTDTLFLKHPLILLVLILPSLYLSAGQTGSEAAALFSCLQEESTLRRAGYASMVQGLTFQALGRTDCHSGRSGCGFSGSLLAGGNHRAGQADAAAC